jgi:hypothetical protein
MGGVTALELVVRRLTDDWGRGEISGEWAMLLPDRARRVRGGAALAHPEARASFRRDGSELKLISVVCACAPHLIVDDHGGELWLSQRSDLVKSRRHLTGR